MNLREMPSRTCSSTTSSHLYSCTLAMGLDSRRTMRFSPYTHGLPTRRLGVTMIAGGLVHADFPVVASRMGFARRAATGRPRCRSRAGLQEPEGPRANLRHPVRHGVL